jgi:DnaJ-class molecular chaperone
MKSTKYIKITTELIECRACQGRGYIDEKFYHNQVKRCICYLCQGTGKLEAENHEDVTADIEDLIEIGFSIINEKSSQS